MVNDKRIQKQVEECLVRMVWEEADGEESARGREWKREEGKVCASLLMLAVVVAPPVSPSPSPSLTSSLSLPFPSYSFAFYPIAPSLMCSVYIGMGIDTRHRGSLAAGAVSYPAAGMLIIGTRAP